MLEFLSALNSLSPLGLAALLALILFFQSRNNKASVEALNALDTIRGNDLHGLPEMTAKLDRIVDALDRVESALNRVETVNAGAFATLIAKINGK